MYCCTWPFGKDIKQPNTTCQQAYKTITASYNPVEVVFFAGPIQGQINQSAVENVFQVVDQMFGQSFGQGFRMVLTVLCAAVSTHRKIGHIRLMEERLPATFVQLRGDLLCTVTPGLCQKQFIKCIKQKAINLYPP